MDEAMKNRCTLTNERTVLFICKMHLACINTFWFVLKCCLVKAKLNQEENATL